MHMYKEMTKNRYLSLHIYIQQQQKESQNDDTISLKYYLKKVLFMALTNASFLCFVHKVSL